MEYIVIGKVLNTFGIKGELKVDAYTDFIDERFKKNSLVYIGDEHLPFKVNNYHFHKGFLLVSFVDNLDINLVEKYKNKIIYKSKDDVKPLENGDYYFSDLKDLDVYVDDKKIGFVKQVEEGIRSNYLRVVKDNKEHLVPYIKEFVLNVDLDNKRIDIKNVEGLF